MTKNRKHKDTGHIIEKTLGNTNEISFSVLDAMSKEAVKESQENPWEINSNEVKKKKKTRKRRKKIAILSIVCIVMCVALAIALSIFRIAENHSGLTSNLKQDIQGLANKCDEQYEVITCLDSLLNSNIDESANSKQIDKLSELQSKIDKWQNEIQTLEEKITDDLNNIVSPDQREIANNAILLSRQQKDILTIAKQVYSYFPDAINNKGVVEEGLKRLLNGDSKDREATSLLLNGNERDATLAIEASKVAKEEFEIAKEQFEKVKKSFDFFEKYVDYCNLKIEAEIAAASTANSFIAKNKEEMKAFNDKYNECSDQASKIADEWEKNPTSKINEKIDGSLKDDRSKFNQAKKYYQEYKNTLTTYLKA